MKQARRLRHWNLDKLQKQRAEAAKKAELRSCEAATFLQPAAQAVGLRRNNPKALKGRHIRHFNIYVALSELINSLHLLLWLAP